MSNLSEAAKLQADLGDVYMLVDLARMALESLQLPEGDSIQQALFAAVNKIHTLQQSASQMAVEVGA